VNAVCTDTCWSSTKPISNASGSWAMSSLASSLLVKYRRSGAEIATFRSYATIER
jgi:hypothetical protein